MRHASASLKLHGGSPKKREGDSEIEITAERENVIDCLWRD
jgi:hypothetical protein